MKKTILAFLLISPFIFLNAQGVFFYNNGDTVFVNTGTDVVVVNGSAHNDVSTGYLENKGVFDIQGDYTNDGLTKGGTLGSQFLLLGDWENNLDFDAQQSEVVLQGVDEFITGIATTAFFDLTLDNSGVKEQEIDAFVDGTLDLNGLQLATEDFKMTVRNTDVAAIDGHGFGGFVSSTNNGRLVRYTNAIDTYVFPTGEVGLYRPLDVVPSTTDIQHFEADLVQGDATLEGYDVTIKEATIDNVNTNFFHRISQSTGTDPAGITIYYESGNDGIWESIARWEDPEWQDLDFITSTGTSTLDYVTKDEVIFNANNPHVLVNKMGEEDENLFAVPNVFTPNGSLVENTTFGVLYQSGQVELDYLRIFNRWGDKVFDSEDVGTESWDGTFRGKKQPGGNYTYLIKMHRTNGEEMDIVDGNVLLVW